MAKKEKYSHEGIALRRVKLRNAKSTAIADTCNKCFYKDIPCGRVRCALYGNGTFIDYYFIRK